MAGQFAGEERSSLPRTLACVDIETTGLNDDDRVVSVGLVLLNFEAYRTGRLEVDLIHEIFDPGRRSHRKAEEVHGYDDWTLRHQRPFSQSAVQLASHLGEADLVIAHNARFDEYFLRREFALAGIDFQAPTFFCTQQEFRRQYEHGSSSLDALLHRMGLKRRTKTHSALLDAWCAMSVYLWLSGFNPPTVHEHALSPPLNLVTPPPHPGLPLPRRVKSRLARNGL